MRWPVLQPTAIFSHTTFGKIQIITFICCITELRVFCILAFIVFKPSGEQDKLFLISQRNSTPQKQQVQTENSRVFNYQLPKISAEERARKNEFSLVRWSCTCFLISWTPSLLLEAACWLCLHLTCNNSDPLMRYCNLFLIWIILPKFLERLLLG